MASLLQWLGFGRVPKQGPNTSVWATGTQAVYPEMNTTYPVRNGFNNNAAVYSIVKKDSKKFGSIPRYVEKKGQEGKAEDDRLEGPLTELLNRPNKFEGQDAFFTKVRAYYKVCGEAYIWLNRGDTDELIENDLIPLDDEAHSKKPILEMYVLPSQDIVIIPDQDNVYGIIGYSLQSRPDIKFRQVDVIQWKDINLSWDVYSRIQVRGMSALQPGRKIVTANDSATDMTVAMNQNGGAKVLLANKSMAQLNPVQESQQKKILDTKINNVNEKGAVSMLQGEWSAHQLGLSSIDMDVLNGKDYSMKEICFLLGMPFALFSDDVTFENQEKSQKGWVINEIVPDCKQLDGELNRFLPKSFGLEGSAIICSDFDSLSELQEDKKALNEWLSAAPVTLDEWLEQLGFPVMGGEDGKKRLVPSGLQLLDDVIAGDEGQLAMESLYNPQPTNGAVNGVKKPVNANR